MNLSKLRRMTAAIPPNIEKKNAPAGAETPEQALLREMKEARTQLLDAVKNKADAKRVDELQRQVDGIDVKLAERHAGMPPRQDLKQLLEESDSIARLVKDKRGTAVIEIPLDMIERKTAITSSDVGVSTSGVLQIDRTPRIVAEARQQLMIRDALTSRPTTLQRIDFVKVNSPLTAGSPQTEGHTKKENAVTFTTAKEDVQTLATWIPASRQVLDDFSELEGFLRTGLSYYVDQCEEVQLLSGSGTGIDLNGLITQATAFDTSLLPLSGSYTRIDVIGRVIQQITTAKELQPTFLVINPVDFWSIRLTKDTQNRYLANTMDPFWGLTPIITTNIAVGSFLVGSGSSTACEIRDRMGMTVEISTSHEDYFARNLLALRAEKRLALVVFRAASFVRGSWLSSP